jgi:RNA polymerase sigma factor (sigma-70 family)
MMTTRIMAAMAEHADANLVSQCLAGNLQAFEKIVTRYQSLICSLAYSATGNISRSEDLAQDTFLAAWKQLHTLREPDRLRPWLCGIARNLINNAFRQQSREPLHRAESLETAHEASSPASLPSEEAIRHEEETLVWSALVQIPENYREALILFYRENQSVEIVARELDLTEDAVKQRLSRGREMLRAQVAEVVEGVLKRSRPGRVFTLAVLAALPGVVAGSATAAGLGSAAGKAALPAAKALVSAGAAGGLLGGLGGLLGAAFGSWVSWETAQYQRQRDLIRRAIIFYGVLTVVFIAPLVAMSFVSRSFVPKYPLVYGISLAAWILGFLLVTLVWSFRLTRQWRRITAEEIAAGTTPLPQSPLVRQTQNWTSKWEGRQWRSRWSLLGWPLIVINFSSPDAQSLASKVTLSALLPTKPNVARGWIAIGDRAYGLLFACGNIAIGGIAIGGVCAGVLSFGGLALGLISIGGGAIGGLALGGLAIGPIAWGGGAFGVLAFGGLAVGWLAFGGGAFAWRAAQGGLAYAHDFATGGKAIAAHANDDAARLFIANSHFFQTAQWQMTQVIPKLSGPWFTIVTVFVSLLVPLMLFAVGYRRKKSPA